jgi:hypothetical protein
MKISGQRTSEFFELETALHKKSVRNSPETVAELLADEFMEFGSSGRVFDKRTIIEMLRNEIADLQVAVCEFWCTRAHSRGGVGYLSYEPCFAILHLTAYRWQVANGFSSGNQNSAVRPGLQNKPRKLQDNPGLSQENLRKVAGELFAALRISEETPVRLRPSIDPSRRSGFASELPLRSRPQSGSRYN